MCEFCHKHGEGKKWYLNAQNYAQDMLSDMRRREFIKDFLGHPEDLRHSLDRLARLERVPELKRQSMSAAVTERQKPLHFGQVLPLEDIAEIFKFATSITRSACICRHITEGGDYPYCYGISLAPRGGAMRELVGEIDASYLAGSDPSGLDELTPEQALQAMAEHEKEGLCHSVWTFVTPFIGGICNCDRPHCAAMISTVDHDVKMMFRAEYVAAADPDLCTGCRACMRVCQFDAIAFQNDDCKVAIDQARCYGCGICRSVCPKGAIRLRARSEAPVAAELW